MANSSHPIKGLHCGGPSRKDLELCIKFIRDVFPREGVNTFVMEVNYGYDYQSRPELANRGSLTHDEMKQIVSACRDVGAELIPQFNCMGHQSWAGSTFSLLSKYPSFDESPGKYPNNEGIYCRSYCPRHPLVHGVIFDLIDELAEVCEAHAFHVGLDEVFILGDDDCPRCGGDNKAVLFADEVNALAGHLKKQSRTLWLWGDRFLDGKDTGIGKWEASMNDTAPAIDLVSKEILICDWHYEKAHPTAAHFALKGFPVLSCPWRKSDVALKQTELIDYVKANASAPVGERMKGMLQTTWCGFAPFARAYYGIERESNRSAYEAADCFKILMKAMREYD